MQEMAINLQIDPQDFYSSRAFLFGSIVEHLFTLFTTPPFFTMQNLNRVYILI